MHVPASEVDPLCLSFTCAAFLQIALAERAAAEPPKLGKHHVACLPLLCMREALAACMCLFPQHGLRVCASVSFQVALAERAAVEPPKLGKHKFEAAPVAVLTSDEVTGSLRQIKVGP
jgi:hypothetical protein